MYARDGMEVKVGEMREGQRKVWIKVKLIVKRCWTIMARYEDVQFLDRNRF